MPVLLAAAVSLLAATLSAKAGRLDIAILQFADARDPGQIAAALQQVDLLKVTDSDRTETSVPGLRGGDVIFVQSLGVGNGAFGSSTRLGNQRADVSGALNGSNLSVKITILQGVKVGIRKYRELNYEGSGVMAGGQAQIIGMRKSKNKSQTVIKNRSQLITYESTSVIVAKYTP